MSHNQLHHNPCSTSTLHRCKAIPQLPAPQCNSNSPQQQAVKTATAVRVPVIGGHGESINLTLEKSFQIDDIKKLLSKSSGIKLEDDTRNFKYPMPIYAKGKDDVFVGRIRKDFSCENSLNLWVVSDNLRKGAATNAIQILELIKSKGFIGQYSKSSINLVV